MAHVNDVGMELDFSGDFSGMFLMGTGVRVFVEGMCCS